MGQAKNLRALRSSSSVRNSIITDNEVDKIDEYNTTSSRREFSSSGVLVEVEDYLLFSALIGLILFEILGTLKLN